MVRPVPDQRAADFRAVSLPEVAAFRYWSRWVGIVQLSILEDQIHTCSPDSEPLTCDSPQCLGVD